MSLFGHSRPSSPRAPWAHLVSSPAIKPAGNREGVYLHEVHAALADELMERADAAFAATQGIAPALTAYILGIGSAYR